MTTLTLQSFSWRLPQLHNVMVGPSLVMLCVYCYSCFMLTIVVHFLLHWSIDHLNLEVIQTFCSNFCSSYLHFFTGKHVVFGRVCEGLEIVERINLEAASPDGTPKQPVTIADCGVLSWRQQFKLGVVLATADSAGVCITQEKIQLEMRLASWWAQESINYSRILLLPGSNSIELGGHIWYPGEVSFVVPSQNKFPSNLKRCSSADLYAWFRWHRMQEPFICNPS